MKADFVILSCLILAVTRFKRKPISCLLFSLTCVLLNIGKLCRVNNISWLRRCSVRMSDCVDTENAINIHFILIICLSNDFLLYLLDIFTIYVALNCLPFRIYILHILNLK